MAVLSEQVGGLTGSQHLVLGQGLVPAHEREREIHYTMMCTGRSEQTAKVSHTTAHLNPVAIEATQLLKPF